MTQPDPFAAALAARVRGRVSTDRLTRALYATDASLYEVMPRAVLRAAEPDDLVAAVETCRENAIPITPRGAGTSLAGQAVGPGLVIDCSRLDAIAIDPEAPIARVGPGAVLTMLNEKASARRLWFGPDTATADRCTLGGMIGNNSSGARSLLYGMTVDHVIAIDAVGADGVGARLEETDDNARSVPGALGDGARAAIEGAARAHDEIERRYPQIPRRVSGYNLDRVLAGRPNIASLVVGSEGTLALVREAELRLVPRPPAAAAVALHFAALEQALEAVPILLPLAPASIELIDRSILRLAAASPGFAPRLGWLDGDPEGVLLVEFLGEEATVAAGVEAAARASSSGVAVRLDEAMRADAWAVRKAGLPLLYSRSGRRRPVAFVEDVAVAPDRMPEFVAAFRDIVSRAGVDAAFYAHAGAGCLHVRPMLDPGEGADRARLLDIQRQVAEEALRLGGAMSGEHGDGRVRGHLLERFFGRAITAVFSDVKRAFDPAAILNPRIIVDPPGPTEDLRLEPARAQPAALNHPEGLGPAAARCFGAGACLKSVGTMCPSYMVTREEEHGTRARANAFRAALSGLVPREELTGPGMAAVMDLCVGCKACKTECPAGVDVAALKIEQLAARWERERPPARDRLFAAMPSIARWASRAPVLANTAARGAMGRALLERLGIARPLPPVARTTLSRWFAHRVGPATGERVRVLADTFTEYFVPAIGRAAVEVLELGGYSVELVSGVCCGRTAMSRGFVARARRLAEGTARALARTNGPVIVLEPSCYAALADDAVTLGVGMPGELHTFDSFVAANVDRFAGLVAADRPATLVHLHCHQRALRGTHEALTAITIAGPATILDAGCCGMAGAFGYETEHVDVSRRMGERALLPAVRAATGPVVAAGFSCREQIESGAGVRAMHPAELIARSLRR